MAQLIINADDFGFSIPINTGIIDCVENGIVNSVSVAANGDEFSSAAEFIRQAPKVMCGWHINLTSGKPVADPALLPTLVDRNGNFFSKSIFLWRMCTGQIHANECRIELTAQLEKLMLENILIEHIDSHHDIHFTPFMTEIIQPLIKNIDVNYIRYQEQLVRYVSKSPVFIPEKLFLKWLTARQLYKDVKNNIDFIWFREFYQAANKLDALFSYVNRMQDGVHLLICHPGYMDDTNTYNLLYNRERELELKALCDRRFKEKIAGHQVELVKAKKHNG